MRHTFALIGLIVGVLAVGLAAFESHLAASAAKQDQRSLGELATDATKKVIKEKILKEPAASEPAIPFHPVRIAYTLLGLTAGVLGLLSWIRREHVRMSGGAVALGLVAVCWQWVLIGVCIAIIILVFAHLGG